MKDLIKYTLATVLGFMLMGVLLTASLIGLVISAIASGDGTKEVSENSVLHIRLDGELKERSTANPLDALLGEEAVPVLALDDATKALAAAAKDENVKGVYLEGGALRGDFASLEEFKAALRKFKKSGKFIFAYADHYSQPAYYVASIADSIALHPQGAIDWHGIASEAVFYKDLLEKLGIKMQIFRVGTYKSFTEPYTRNEMSPENREQMQSLIDDIWRSICTEVAAERHIDIDSLKAYAADYASLENADYFVKRKLATAAMQPEEVRSALRRLAKSPKVNLISAQDLLNSSIPEGKRHKVAVYYALGSIVDEGSTSLGEDEIVGKKVVRDLDKIMNDEDIKAVVVRINSGGGSAFASEQMHHAIGLLREKKPVIVSMGGTAASGGYYMACAADRIFADKTSITGSIGIFGMVPEVSGLVNERLGIHFDAVRTNKGADFGGAGTLARPLPPSEGIAIQRHVDKRYDLFLRRVAEARKKQKTAVASIAQGRVWTGKQALDIGLADSIGTLREAIEEAARLAGLDTYSTTHLPQQAEWYEQLPLLAEEHFMEGRLQKELGIFHKPLNEIKRLETSSHIQARLPFELQLN